MNTVTCIHTHIYSHRCIHTYTYAYTQIHLDSGSFGIKKTDEYIYIYIYIYIGFGCVHTNPLWMFPFPLYIYIWVCMYICTVMFEYPTKLLLYGHLPPILKTIQIRWTRYARHCWRSKDELVSDVLLWTPSHGRARVG